MRKYYHACIQVMILIVRVFIILKLFFHAQFAQLVLSVQVGSRRVGECVSGGFLALFYEFAYNNIYTHNEV